MRKQEVTWQGTEPGRDSLKLEKNKWVKATCVPSIGASDSLVSDLMNFSERFFMFLHHHPLLDSDARTLSPIAVIQSQWFRAVTVRFPGVQVLAWLAESNPSEYCQRVDSICVNDKSTKIWLWDREMVPQVDVLAGKPNNLSLVTEIQMVEAENWLLYVFLWLPHVLCGTRAHRHEVDH